MTHLSFRDQDSAEAYYKLNLKQIQPTMNDTHRFQWFLNNSTQTHGFLVNELFYQNNHPL